MQSMRLELTWSGALSSRETARRTPRARVTDTHKSPNASVKNYAPEHRGSTQKTPAGDAIAWDEGLALAYAQLNHITDTPTTKVDINWKQTIAPTCC